jgi:hypothetical protein
VVAHKQRLLEESKRQKVAEEHDDSVACLRSDLAAPWTSLVVALRYDCSCTGTSHTGFKIVHENDAFLVFPWMEEGSMNGPRERVGDERAMDKAAVQKLLSETALYYLAATLSINPLERVGPRPREPAKSEAWIKEYLAAGGSREAGDEFWIEVRIATHDGVAKHADMFDRHYPADFGSWITAFGLLKNNP